ncbi:MAG: hypothetical protein ACKOUS_04780 [Alphaproteobacteria bacterium]
MLTPARAASSADLGLRENSTFLPRPRATMASRTDPDPIPSSLCDGIARHNHAALIVSHQALRN